jgi:hypothetical protein
MGIYRVFAGSDGESHIEELRLEEHPALGALTNIHEVRGQQFDGTRQRDFHPLPARRLIIHLSGEVEMGTSDGSTQVFRAGDIRLMEDVTGRGHTHVDRSPSAAVSILLKDEDGGESRARAHAVRGRRRLTERGCPGDSDLPIMLTYETGEADMSGRLWRCDGFPLPWKADMAACRRGSSHAPSSDSDTFCAVRAMRAVYERGHGDNRREASAPSYRTYGTHGSRSPAGPGP